MGFAIICVVAIVVVIALIYVAWSSRKYPIVPDDTYDLLMQEMRKRKSKS